MNGKRPKSLTRTGVSDCNGRILRRRPQIFIVIKFLGVDNFDNKKLRSVRVQELHVFIAWHCTYPHDPEIIVSEFKS